MFWWGFLFGAILGAVVVFLICLAIAVDWLDEFFKGFWG